MILTADTLAQAVGISPARAAVWLPRLGAAFDLAEINTPQRTADFLAQAGHESLGFAWTRELWGPTPQQLRYERNFGAAWPESTKQARTDALKVNRLAYTLGNARAGDGKRYMGRGLIQTTGRTNYILTTNKLKALVGERVPDFVSAPSMLEVPEWAALSAALFWREKKLNQFADNGDFLTLTKRINGGTHGLGDRTLRRARAIGALA